jgi:hypothetical protein
MSAMLLAGVVMHNIIQSHVAIFWLNFATIQFHLVVEFVKHHDMM